VISTFGHKKSTSFVFASKPKRHNKKASIIRGNFAVPYLFLKRITMVQIPKLLKSPISPPFEMSGYIYFIIFRRNSFVNPPDNYKTAICQSSFLNHTPYHYNGGVCPEIFSGALCFAAQILSRDVSLNQWNRAAARFLC